MKVFCLGDSLTEGDYGVFGKSGIANVKSENYSYFLQKLSGCEVFNFGKCGFNATSYLNFINNGGINETDPDIIVIMLGTNGGMAVEPKSQGYFDYIEIINYCKNEFPKADIVLCTPPHATENDYYSNCGYMSNIISAEKAVRQIAEDLKLPLIDVFGFEEFCEENTSKYQSADGLHFNEAGYKTLAEFIFQNLKTLFPERF